ncbi:helix-turn-helix domain-containing protein [Streptomyces sp. TOR3209]|uniref:helix-turn-helix domain-containing protein n=1 Tax=Streptomyces sp. TOR3209 TaxID=1073567 RepID=UPI0002D5A08A|nr:pyridoxamine 5'-phosphate oxidase family protein [Streptomyces sp. TOR3209]
MEWTVVHADPERSGDEAQSSYEAGRMSDRMALRLRQLGISRDELAMRAGMSTTYLREVESRAGDFDPEALARLAVVLKMPYEELTTGRTDAPPGRGEPARHPVLVRLSEQECWQRLGTHGIGRISYTVGPGREAPVVVPVNFLVDGRSVVFRTDPAGAAGVRVGEAVAFEADHVDEQTGLGWSVLLAGTAEHPADREALEALARRRGTGPWAGGKRDLWVRVLPHQVSGRAIQPLRET